MTLFCCNRCSGAVGSRLTGAGWGGCTVSLVLKEKLVSFMEAMKEGYYAKNPQLRAKTNDALFATQPAKGADFYIVPQ